MSSTISNTGLVATAGIGAGGVGLYQGLKKANKTIENAKKIADPVTGFVRIGGKTKDGMLWDGVTHISEITKKAKNQALKKGAKYAGAAVLVTTILLGIASAIKKSHKADVQK